jgi:hypothetical protein
MRIRLGFGLVLGLGAIGLAACGLGTGESLRGTSNLDVPGKQNSARLDGPVTLILNPAFNDARFGIQEIVSEWTAADVEHLIVRVFEMNPSGVGEGPINDQSGNPIRIDIPRSQLGTSLSIGGLHRGTNYRVRTYAYRTSGESNKISVDEESFTDVPVGSNTEVAVASLKCQLAPKDFSGAGSTTVDIRAGGIRNSSQPSISLQPTPVPTPMMPPPPDPTPEPTPTPGN